jgi:hypothetical protein
MLLVFSLFIIIILFIGLNIEYSPDSFFPASFRGVINDVQFETFYLYLIYWDKLLIKLYHYFPSVSWYGLLFILYNIPILSLLYLSLNKIIQSYNSLLKILIIIIVAIIWSLSLFYIGLTRMPFFVTGAVWLYILTNNNKNYFRDIVLGLIVAGSCFIRYESMLAALFLLIPSISFVYFNQKEKFRSVLKRILFIFSIGFLGLILHNQIYNQPNDLLARDFYDVHFNFFDASQKHTFSNDKDSIRLVAMSMDFNADKDSLNIEQYKRLTLGNPLKIIDTNLLKQKLLSFEKGIKSMQNDNFFLFNLLGIFLIITTLLCYKNPTNLLLLFINLLWGLIIIFSVIFFIKYAERVVQPMIILFSIIILISLFYSTASPFFIANKITYTFVIILILISYIPLINHYKNLNNSLKNKIYNNYETLIILSKINQREKRDIIFTNDAMELFITGTLHEWQKEELIVYSLDTHINYLRGGEDALNQYSGSSTLIGFYQFISNKKNKPIIISSEKRMKMLSDYFRILYKYRFEVKNINNNYPNTILNENLNLNLYELEVFQSN